MDMDGTLLNSKDKISQKTKDALIECQKNGIKIVLASGRNYGRIKPYLEELHLEEFGGLLIEINGIAIYDMSTNQRTILRQMHEDEVHPVFSYLMNLNAESIAVYDEGLFDYMPDHILTMKQKLRLSLDLPEDYPWTAGAWSWFWDMRNGYPCQKYIEKVEEKIEKACERSGRSRSDVTLIAVSKTKPIEMMQEAMQAGVSIFGENKVQEIVKKEVELPKNVEWHLIGHLQRNKVRQIAGKVARIHSVDSLRLAEQIQKEYEKIGETANILIEVNVAKEESKFGLMPEETEEVIREIAKFPNIKVRGLMTIAPFVENPEENRIHFQNLRKLLVDINAKNIDNISMNELSMGMTGDYEVAIEEGATYVRVGTGIFGSRQY